MPESLKYLLQQADIGRSRSSVLNPLQWVLVIVIAGLAIIAVAPSPSWLIVLMATILVFTFLLIAGAYVFFMFKNPDAIRSEQFQLSKLAIEKGLVGDSLSGLFEGSELPSSGARQLQLPSQGPKA